MNRDHDNFFERLHIARAHGALNDRLGKSAQRILQYEPQDSLTRQLLETRLRQIEQALKSGRLPPFPAAKLDHGNLALGMDPHKVWVKIWLDWLCSGMLTVANTGSGKTTFLFWVACQLASLTDSFSTWYFDPYKTQLRLLLPVYRRAGKPFIILPWQSWRINLLQIPSHGNLNSHTSTVVDLLVRALSLPGRAATILRQAIHELYKKFQVNDGQAGRFPTLFHVFEYLRIQRDANAPAREAILDRLGAFLIALTPTCGAWTLGWRNEDLMDHNIVFELRGASETVRSILPQSLLFGVFQSRIATGLVNSPLRLLLVIDDAQRILGDCTTTVGDMSPLDELAGIIRGAGIGLWPIIQTTIGFSNRLRPNMAIKIAGRLGAHEDFSTMAADCGWTSEQVEYLRHRLVPGMFVGHVGLGDYTYPFLFGVPPAKLPLPLTDAEIQASQSPLANLPTVFAEEFSHWSPHPVTEIRSEENSPATLTELELRLLRAVVGEPCKSVTYYCRITRINGARLAELRKRLIGQGYIRESRVALKARGRASIIIEPLPLAGEAIRNIQ